MNTEQFLTSVYLATSKRCDSYLELVMALTASEYVESVVSLSESPLYRRGFSSVYETLKEVGIDEAALLKAKLGVLSASCAALTKVPRPSGKASSRAIGY